MYNSQFFYGNPSGSIPAPAGWYWDGTYTYEINQFGVLIAVGTGSGCTCAPTLYAISVCASDTFCTACCCVSYTQTIYGDNANLANCTVLYADNTGTTLLIPNRYYKNADAQARVGANGYTITAFGNCSTCNCGGNPNNGVYARAASAPTETVYAEPSAACSCTSQEQYETVFTDADTFFDSTVFYYDTNSTLPLGTIGANGATGYISDGEFVKYYEGATAAGATLNCTDFAPVDRTNSVTFRAISFMGTDMVANFRYFTCPDPSTYLFLDEATYPGFDWDETHVIDYNPTNFTAATIIVDIPAIVTYDYFQSGIGIDRREERLEPGREYTFQSRLPVENYPTEIYFRFTPA
jgi:hypothetical protein